MASAAAPDARGHVVLCGRELRVTGDAALHVRWSGHKLDVLYRDRRAAHFALRPVQSVGEQRRARALAAAASEQVLWTATDAEIARLAALTPAQTRDAEDAPRPRPALLARNTLAALTVAGACRVTLTAPQLLHERHFELKVGGSAQLTAASVRFPSRLRCAASAAAALTLGARCRITRLRAIAQGTSALTVDAPVARLVEKTVRTPATATIAGDPPVEASTRGRGSLVERAPAATAAARKRTRAASEAPSPVAKPPKKRART